MSDAVVRVIEELEPTRQAIFEAQTAYGQTRWNEHLAVDLRLAGGTHLGPPSSPNMQRQGAVDCTPCSCCSTLLAESAACACTANFVLHPMCADVEQLSCVPVCRSG